MFKSKWNNIYRVNIVQKNERKYNDYDEWLFQLVNQYDEKTF